MVIELFRTSAELGALQLPHDEVEPFYLGLCFELVRPTASERTRFRRVSTSSGRAASSMSMSGIYPDAQTGTSSDAVSSQSALTCKNVIGRA